RASSASDAYGTGSVSQGMGSSAGTDDAAGRAGGTCGCFWGPRCERPREGGRRRCGRLRSVVFESNWFWLAGPGGDDAATRIVRRDADGHAVTRHDFDAKAAHAAAELREHFVAGVALHAVQPAAVDSHDRALHINEVILAQLLAIPFCRQQ